MSVKIDRDFTNLLKKRLEEPLKFIQVILGPRQIGKTTAIKDILSTWSGPSLMVTADEVASPSPEWITLHWNRARQLGPNTLLVFDEIQKVRDWSRVIKVLFDEDREKEQLKIVLLGSASMGIQQGLTESLAGRYEYIPAPHWTYSECKKAFNWDLSTFITYGGYPAAAPLISDFQRWKDYISLSIIEPVLNRDILLSASVHKPALFRQCFELAMAYPAQEIALIKLLGQLQEAGNVSTIKNYLTLFEGAFLIKSLQKYSGSESRQRQSSPKIFPLNNALSHALHGTQEITPPDYGRLFEAAVGTTLAQLPGKLYYWRDGNHEVDFIYKTQKKLYAIEVKSTRPPRSTKGLQTFLRLYPEAIPVIIDETNAERFFLESGAFFTS